VAALVVTELARQFKEAFVGFGAAVAEKNFPGSNPFDKRLRQTALGFVVVEVGDMNKLLRLLQQGIGDFGIGMAKGTNGDPPTQVEVTFAGHIINVTAGAVAEGQIEAGVARHDVLE